MRRLLSVLFVLFASALHADVRVVFKIESTAMKSRYSADREKLELEVAEKIAVALKAALPHWTYVTAEPSAGRIEVQVDSNKTKVHTFRVTIMGDGMTHLSKEVTWVKPGEFEKQIGKYPPRKDAPQMLADAIAKYLIAPEQDSMLHAMYNVPITVRSEWAQARGRQEEPRIVTAAPWDGGKLGASMFAVKCRFRPPQNGVPPEDDGVNRMFESQGLLTPRKFKGERSEYDALTLRPIRRVIGEKKVAVAKLARSEVEKFQPLAVYLVLFDPLGLRIAQGE